MTRIYKSSHRYGAYLVQLKWWQKPAYRVGRLRDWWIDQLAEFRGFREENETWRKLVRPYYRATEWIARKRPTPNTIEEMHKRGVYDAEKLGL